MFVCCSCFREIWVIQHFDVGLQFFSIDAHGTISCSSHIRKEWGTNAGEWQSKWVPNQITCAKWSDNQELINLIGMYTNVFSTKVILWQYHIYHTTAWNYLLNSQIPSSSPPLSLRQWLVSLWTISISVKRVNLKIKWMIKPFYCLFQGDKIRTQFFN